MILLQMVIQNEVGLHARPAALLVQCASQFNAKIEIRKIGPNSEIVNAKSILGVLTLGVNQGEEIVMIFEGEDEEKAATKIKRLIDTNFVNS